MVTKMSILAPVYVVMGVILMVVPPTIEQQQHQQQQQPNQAELQAVLFLHNLMKTNPDLGRLIKAAAAFNDNGASGLPQGVTMNPLLSVVLAGVKNFQNPLATLTNQFASSQNSTDSNETSTLDTTAAFQHALQNPLLRDVFSAVVAEIQNGMAKAAAANITSGSNNTSLLSYVNPLSIIRKVAVPGFAMSQLPNEAGLVSPACYRDLIDSMEALVAGEGWAIEMFDALGKPTSGIERGSFYFVGSYDECQRIKPVIEKEELILKTRRSFNTRHCRVDISIPSSLTNAINVDTKGVHLKLIWGMCVPDSCHSNDIKGLFKLGVLKRANLTIEDVKCQIDTDIGTDKSAIAAITVLSFFGFMILVGTLYEGCKEFNKSTECRVQQNTRPSAQDMNGYTDVRDKKHVDTSTNGDVHITSPGVQKPTEANVNGGYTAGPPTDQVKTTDASSDQNMVSKDEEKLDLPRGYMPHREGPVIPLPKSKPRPFHDDFKNGNIVSKTEQGTAGRATVVDRAPREPLVIRLILCFSLYTNIPKILQAKSAPSSITCVHGIRFFSLMWVVLGHTYNYGIISNEGSFTSDNLLDFEAIIQRFTYQAVMAGGYAVDTFFVLSAFLLTWIQLKEAEKRKKKINFNTGFMYYFHRIWRLTPIYMIVLMTYTCLYRYFGAGPFWPKSIGTADNCKDVWWTNMLYINNLVETDKQCMGWSWYLANDMQFYIVSPFFIIAMYMSAIRGAVFTTLLMLMGIGIAFWKEHVYNGNFLTMLSDGGDYWKEVYTVPWCRVSPWAVGMLLGLIIFKRGKKPLKNTMYYAIGWLAATGVALFLVYITYTTNKKEKGGTPWTREENALYESVGRAMWGICVAWLIFACHTGKGGLVNSILSWNGLIPLSRLTYAAYLVHPICMEVYMFNRRNLIHVTDYNIIYLFLGHSCIAFMVAFVCSSAFEAPFMALEKVMFPTRRR